MDSVICGADRALWSRPLAGVEWMVDWRPGVAPLQDDEVIPTQIIMDMIVIVAVAAPSIFHHRHAAVHVTAVVAVRTVTIARRQHTILRANIQVHVGVVCVVRPDLLVREQVQGESVAGLVRRPFGALAVPDLRTDWNACAGVKMTVGRAVDLADRDDARRM